MRDDGLGNEFVGHRRWLNYSRAQVMGTGDVPSQGSYNSSNALWVIGGFKGAPTPKFVAWPNRGYAPHNLVPARWSLSYPGADFSGATVTMTRGMTYIPTVIISNAAVVYGDNTLVWTPSGLPAAVTADTSYNVTVSGISGPGVPASYSYTVTLFDPGVLNVLPTIAGSATPATTGTMYTFDSIDQADAYQLRVTTANTAAWNEGAEDPSTKIVASTTGSYPLRQSAVKRTGTKAFQLAFPTFDDQSFTITRDLIPSASSQIRFYDLGHFAVTSCTLHMEVSTNGGASWINLWGRNGVGLSTVYWEPAFIARSVSLAAYAGQILRIRFVLRTNGGSAVISTTANDGFFIDDVTVTNVTELVNETTTTLAGAATSFTLNSSTAGTPLVVGTAYYLRVRPSVGTRWFADGAPKIVTAQAPTGYAAWVATRYPTVTGGPTGDHDCDGLMNGVEYAFGLDPTATTSGSVLPRPSFSGNNYTVTNSHPVGVTGASYGAQWTRNLSAWTPVADSGSLGYHTFTVNKLGETRVYFRYAIVVDP